MTINHITLLIPRSQFSKVVDWYIKALAPLNYVVQLGHMGLTTGREWALEMDTHISGSEQQTRLSRCMSLLMHLQ